MSSGPPAGFVRLQKFLSDAGVASRRHAEEYILAGKVLVNGEVVDRLPAFVDPKRDVVVFDGTRVRPAPLEYFIVHKPKGVVCTMRDPAGRRRAIDLLPPLPWRLFPVGRLDADSSGLLLMTNDGELAYQITHPRFGVPKKYWVEVRGPVPQEVVPRLLRGVHLAEGRAQAVEVQICHVSRQRSVLHVTLREGRRREIRRMFAKLGFVVKNLKRIQIGPLTLKGLPVGAARRLSAAEIRALRAAVADAAKAAASNRTARRPSGQAGATKTPAPATGLAGDTALRKKTIRRRKDR